MLGGSTAHDSIRFVDVEEVLASSGATFFASEAVPAGWWVVFLVRAVVDKVDVGGICSIW